MLGLDPWEQAVLKKWKSLKKLRLFMTQELDRINQNCFQGLISRPEIILKRTKYSRSLHGGHFGADYKPPNGNRSARIGINSILLMDESDVVAALAHEMVHHWEFEIRSPQRNWDYPEKIDELIRQRLKDPGRQKSWKATHSPRFLFKSWEVSRRLKIPLRDFLFK